MPDFLTQLLAQLVNAFKAKSPKIAAIILLVLGTVVGFADQGTLLGLLTLPAWLAAGVKWVGTLLGFLTGSQTWQYLTASNPKTK
jgi:uncharacterized membrane protein YkvI